MTNLRAISGALGPEYDMRKMTYGPALALISMSRFISTGLDGGSATLTPVTGRCVGVGNPPTFGFHRFLIESGIAGFAPEAGPIGSMPGILSVAPPSPGWPNPLAAMPTRKSIAMILK